MENKPTYYTAKSGYAYSGSTWVGGKVPEDWSNIIVNPRHTLIRVQNTDGAYQVTSEGVKIINKFFNQ